MGNLFDEANPFHWERVVKNLLFSAAYRASLPRLKKVHQDGLNSSEVV